MFRHPNSTQRDRQQRTTNYRTKIGGVLLAGGAAGVFTSSIYLCMVLAAAFRFRRHAGFRARTRDSAGPFTPAVSVFKPLHGLEPSLADNLRSFFEQDCLPPVADTGIRIEFLFCARDANDPGLLLAREMAACYPQLDIRTFFTDPGCTGPNDKLCSLHTMACHARTDLWLLSDSDVRVTPDYLRRMVEPFADAATGCVTCLYRGVAGSGALAAMLEAVGMSVDMVSGVIVDEMLEPLSFALGPSMAVRRACVESEGGFGALAGFCADDFVLGNRISRQPGRRAVLSDYVVDHLTGSPGLRPSLERQARWMKSTRCSRPRGHLGSGLTFATPFGLAAFLGGLLLRRRRLGATLLGVSIAGRMLQAFVVSRYVVQERTSRRTALLYPLRDFLGFCFWIASYANRKIVWQGKRYELDRDGRMRRL